jgi:hypothetical protein
LTRSDEVVGTHLQAEQLVDLLVLGGEENDRHVGLLPQPPQQFHAVHARHLDVEDGEVRRAGLEALQRRGAVRVGHDPVAFGFERDRNRSQDVAVVIDQGDGRHGRPSSMNRPRAKSPAPWVETRLGNWRNCGKDKKNRGG